jgi:hypothetical protein
MPMLKQLQSTLPSHSAIKHTCELKELLCSQLNNFPHTAHFASVPDLFTVMQQG